MTAEKNLSPALGLILIAAGIFIAVSLVSYPVMRVMPRRPVLS